MSDQGRDGPVDDWIRKRMSRDDDLLKETRLVSDVMRVAAIPRIRIKL